MVQDSVIKDGDIVFIYKSPTTDSLAGIVHKIDYPKIEIITIPLDNSKIKYKRIETIDVSENIPLTLIKDDVINKVFSAKEIKFIQSIIKEESIDDIFA